jgi:hypothetical protein
MKDGNQAEAAALSEATATPGRAAATATGPLRSSMAPRLALDAGDGVTRLHEAFTRQAGPLPGLMR